LKHTSAIYAGLVAIGLACTEPATAQLLAYPPVGNMPPHEVITLVRSAGLEPVSRPVRHGPAYVLQATNPAGRELRVVVDARLRRIVRVVAIGPARPPAEAGVPPLPEPYGRPPAAIASVPEGTGPAARATATPLEVDEEAPYGRPYGQVAGIGTMPAIAPSRTPVPVTGPTTSQASPPPLPRPRPKLAAAEPAAPVPAATANADKPTPPVRSKGIAAQAAFVPEPTYEEHE
jgi:hypothetical protein